MNAIMKLILSLSLSGGFLILVVLLIRPLLKKWASKRFRYYIWLVVIARLLLPFAPETSLVGILFQEIDGVTSLSETAIPPVEEGRAILQLPEDGPDLEEYNHAAPRALMDEKASVLSARSVLMFFKNYLWLIWLVVAIVLFVRKITLYQSFVKYVRSAWSEISDPALLNRLAEIGGQAGVRRPVELHTNSMLFSPVLLGIFRPCIVLNSTDLTAEDFTNTILHELTHCRRRDMLYKWLVQLVVCMHWFNPLVYLMAREVNRACELSCDEAVIRTLDEDKRKAYGETLLHAINAGGNYKNSLASVTLNESKELLKERLDAIMDFKKATRFTAAASVTLVCVLCFGGVAAGAYTGMPPAVPAVVTEASSEAGDALRPSTMGNLTLAEKEYTLSELKEQNISGVIALVDSENVTVSRGGDTLKFSYYAADNEEYTLSREGDGGNTRWNLCLVRNETADTDTATREINIIIPRELELLTIKLTTDSGNIQMRECSADMFLGAYTRSGQILIDDCSAKSMFKVHTDTGAALITGTTLPVNGVNYSSGSLHTESGAIQFQPAGSAMDHRYRIDAGESAQVTVNGKVYAGGSYNINNFSHSQIDFSTTSGSLVVQDTSMGKLTLPAITMPVTPTSSTGTDSLTYINKEYTAADLEVQGITGLYVNVPTENIVVTQGGPSLLIRYEQASKGEYALTTRQYEIYQDGYGPDWQEGLPGTIGQLVLSREDAGAPGEAARTIHITLPADAKFNRVVKVVSGSGAVSLRDCTVSAYLTADSGSGSVLLAGCNAPSLYAGTRGGLVTISDCQVDQLDAVSTTGSVTVHTPDSLKNYRLLFRTVPESRITVDGEVYQGGQFDIVTDERATRTIHFDNVGGSVEISGGVRQ